MWEELESRGAVSENFEFDRLQLDLLKADFSWEKALYFNNENVPLETLREIVTLIRAEFIDQTLHVEGRRGRLTGAIKRYFKKLAVVIL